MSARADSLTKTNQYGCWIFRTAGAAVQRLLARRYGCWMLVAVSLAAGGCRATRQADQVTLDSSGAVLRDPLPVEYSPGPRGIDPRHAGYSRPQWRVLASRPADCCSEGCEECVGPGLILKTGDTPPPSSPGEAASERLEMPDLEPVPAPPVGEEPEAGLETNLPIPDAPAHHVGSSKRLDTSVLLGLPRVEESVGP